MLGHFATLDIFNSNQILYSELQQLMDCCSSTNRKLDAEGAINSELGDQVRLGGCETERVFDLGRGTRSAGSMGSPAFGQLGTFDIFVFVFVVVVSNYIIVPIHRINSINYIIIILDN